MKIAVITQYFPNSAQQWAGHSAYQTLRLLARKHSVRVFYPESRYPTLLTPKSRTHGRLDPNFQPDGVETTYIPYTALPLISRPLNGWLISQTLLPHVRTYAPDIILNYVVYPDGYAAVRIGQKLNIPVVLTAIGSDLNRISDAMCARHTKYALQHAAYTTTVSNDLLRTAHKLGANFDRSSAILNGCNTSIFHPMDRQIAREQLQVSLDTEVVVYVGRLDIRKGLVELVDSIAQLRDQRPSLHCYLVGDGPDKSLLETAIRTRNIGSQVHFVPACMTSRVAQWMAAADLITLPSYNEGCPNVVIEALSSGRPVVATHVGGIPELVDNACGRLILPRDVKTLQTALNEVLNTAWNAEEIGARFHRSWQDVADELENVLEKTRHTYVCQAA
ncbi:MAG: glycosyltransferase [Acidobacteria bacterium]|nr:glycosyltransferase [Acidobacteriota bacterium]